LKPATVPDDWAGKVGKCNACGHRFALRETAATRRRMWLWVASGVCVVVCVGLLLYMVAMALTQPERGAVEAKAEPVVEQPEPLPPVVEQPKLVQSTSMPLVVDVEPFNGSHWEGRYSGITITGDPTKWLKCVHRALFVNVELWDRKAGERARVEDIARKVAAYYGSLLVERFPFENAAWTVRVDLHCPPKPGAMISPVVNLVSQPTRPRTIEDSAGFVEWSKTGKLPVDIYAEWND